MEECSKECMPLTMCISPFILTLSKVCMMLKEARQGSRVLRIDGGQPLSGDLRVYPAKNAALPILAASSLPQSP